MLLENYLIGRFYKDLFLFSLFFTLFGLAAQLFNTFHLIVSMPLWISLSYLVLNLIYTYVLSLGLSTPLVSANLIYELKEHRIFHVLFTFGVSEKRAMKTLWRSILVLSLLGILVSPIINYQRISHITKYLKVKFGERILLTIPPKSFLTEEDFSFFFLKRSGNRFEKVVVQSGSDTATAKEAELKSNGLLVLKSCSLFSKQKDFSTYMESERYILSLGGKYTYTLPKRKLLKNALFLASLFLFPILVFPFYFYLIYQRAETKFSTIGWALLITLIQLGLALISKSLV